MQAIFKGSQQGNSSRSLSCPSFPLACVVLDSIYNRMMDRHARLTTQITSHESSSASRAARKRHQAEAFAYYHIDANCLHAINTIHPQQLDWIETNLQLTRHCFENVKVLGKGGQGIVRAVRNKNTGTLYAVKIFSTEKNSLKEKSKSLVVLHCALAQHMFLPSTPYRD